MFKSYNNYVLFETCKYCANRYPFTTEYFVMCNECHQIFCSVKCVKECGCGKNICPICDEEIKRKYKTVGVKCRECASEFAYMKRRFGWR